MSSLLVQTVAFFTATFVLRQKQTIVTMKGHGTGCKRRKRVNWNFKRVRLEAMDAKVDKEEKDAGKEADDTMTTTQLVTILSRERR